MRCSYGCVDRCRVGSHCVVALVRMRLGTRMLAWQMLLMLPQLFQLFRVKLLAYRVTSLACVLVQLSTLLKLIRYPRKVTLWMWCLTMQHDARTCRRSLEIQG